MTDKTLEDRKSASVFNTHFLRANDRRHLRWVVECLREDRKGNTVRCTGKHGPDWDFASDPYAMVGEWVLETGSGEGDQCVVVDIRHKS